ncbi:hypothetical protein RJT34_12118 [Clitoria ternatea]|uniref:Pentatricopeptide repeat-containing protein n=1 Tax=Clitoria ternatea TaxID=43366 RepID=A0AAN9JLA3_CLITE
MVRILGRESWHLIESKLFNLIPVEEYSLDVRAYTTILHAYGHSGKYNQVIYIFEKMKEFVIGPTLVTYNNMLNVYGKIGRSWNRILDLLDEMRSKGLQFDEFIYSTVISSYGREGMLDEARNSFAELKLSGYKPGTVTYNVILQVFRKAGIYTEALNVLKEIEDNNCPVDFVTYNDKGVLPNAITYTTVIDAYAHFLIEQKENDGSWSHVIDALLDGNETSSSTINWLLEELLKDKLQL